MTGGAWPGRQHDGVPGQALIAFPYLYQVARIAPARLLDRDDEMEALTQFCTDPGRAGQYSWWRASMWSGKTAFMSWFVLHPPPGVQTVSFFVTARLAAQSDRGAFVQKSTTTWAKQLAAQAFALLSEWILWIHAYKRTVARAGGTTQEDRVIGGKI